MFIARVATALLAALVFALPVEAATAPVLRGTVGPEFTISLKRDAKRVTTLRPGPYLFVVADRSTVHNLRLEGPGIRRDLTGVARVGTTRTTLRLRPGRYASSASRTHSTCGGRSPSGNPEVRVTAP